MRWPDLLLICAVCVVAGMAATTVIMGHATRSGWSVACPSPDAGAAAEPTPPDADAEGGLSSHAFTRHDEDAHHIGSEVKTTAIVYACTGPDEEPMRVCLQFNRDDKPRPGTRLGYEYTIAVDAAERLGRKLVDAARDARHP